MRSGYAHAAGRLMPASEVTYAMTASMLVVCPSCQESVVKVVRPTDAGATHYLRHRREATDQLARETQDRCELRVAAMERRARGWSLDAALDKAAADPHGQGIEAFVDALCTMVEGVAFGVSATVVGVGNSSTAFCQPGTPKFAGFVKSMLGQDWPKYDELVRRNALRPTEGTIAAIMRREVGNHAGAQGLARCDRRTEKLLATMGSRHGAKAMTVLVGHAVMAAVDLARLTVADMAGTDDHKAFAAKVDVAHLVDVATTLGRMPDRAEATAEAGAVLPGGWLAGCYLGASRLRSEMARKRLSRLWTAGSAEAMDEVAREFVAVMAGDLVAAVALAHEIDEVPVSHPATGPARATAGDGGP